MQPKTTYDYHLIFLVRHPDDRYLYDDKARWQPEWHEYKLNDNIDPVYETRMLFSPKRKPYLNVYMLWSDSVHLTDTKYFIHDPSKYDAHGEFIQPKQHMALIGYVFFLRFVTSLVSPPPSSRLL